MSARSASVAATRVSVAPLADADVEDLVKELAGLDRGPVELDDQRRPAIRIARMDDLLACLDRQPIHHLDRCRCDAGGDDARHRLARITHCRERREDGLRRLRDAHDPERDLGHDAESPFAADHDAQQVVARGITH